MGSVVKSLDKAINSMELQKISAVMDKFETQFEDLDVRSAVSDFFYHPSYFGKLKTISNDDVKIDIIAITINSITEDDNDQITTKILSRLQKLCPNEHQTTIF